MDFIHRKLPQSASSKLRLCPLRTVAPYALLFAPMYLYMRRNAKYVAIKGPLDFFEPHELEKIKSIECLFVPKSAEAVTPFRNAARAVYGVLTWEPKVARDVRAQESKGYPRVPLPISPYEAADGTLRLIAPLWGKELSIDPFLATVFTNELCDILPGDELLRAKGADFDRYELAVLRSGLAVFLALHLGYCNLPFLNSFRLRVFRAAVAGEMFLEPASEAEELIRLVFELVEYLPADAVTCESLRTRTDKVARKLGDRLKRVESEFLKANAATPLVHGPGGLFDV